MLSCPHTPQKLPEYDSAPCTCNLVKSIDLRTPSRTANQLLGLKVALLGHLEFLLGHLSGHLAVVFAKDYTLFTHMHANTHTQTYSSMSMKSVSMSKEFMDTSCRMAKQDGVLDKEEAESVCVPTAMSYDNVSLGKCPEMRHQPIVCPSGTRAIITSHLVHVRPMKESHSCIRN